MSEISISGLEKSFGRLRVLRQLDLVVPDHALAAVLGPSGCGKTTLLRLIAGFEAADAGSIAIGGEVVDDCERLVPPEARRVGYVPQEGALFPHLSVAQNVGFGLPRRKRDRSTTIAETLELVGLGGLEDRRPNELSGGQQQRVALARALAPRPQVILLDEPFAALDPTTRFAMRAEIAALLRTIGTTAILVTHDQAEALSVTDLVAVIHDGRVAQVDSPQRLYARPASRDVASFVGEANLVPARIEGELAHTALGALPLVPGSGGDATGAEPATILVRPEQILIGPPGELTARVTGTVFFGHDALVSLELGSTSLEARTSERVPELGELVGVRIAGAVVVIPSDAAPVAAGAAPPPAGGRWWRRFLA